MQALHPIQEALSKSMIPSGRAYMAEVGQAGTQGALEHWLHLVTWKDLRVSG